ncbi:MAG: hypothetical protein L7H03_01995 [Vulcanisaeta sp.]|nr:hypothetical protein [Vulcanisaeta sp.]
MNPKAMNDLFILKIMVAKELQKVGSISVNEFSNLIAKIMHYADVVGYLDDVSNYMIYFLDIININGDKVTLSEDGIRYLRTFEILANGAPKLP